MIQSFTEEQIQGFKKASAKDHDGRVIQIDIDDPISCTIVVAPFNRAEFAAHVDATSRDRQTSFVGALIGQLLYPSLQEVEALRQEWATLPGAVRNELMDEAGLSAEAPLVRRFSLDALPAGLSADEAKALTEKHKGGRLWSVEVPAHELSVVMRAPVADTWLASRAQEDDARSKHEGIVAAIDPYVLGAVVWQRSALTGGTGILDRRPALLWDLLTAYRIMGGDGAAVRRKSL